MLQANTYTLVHTDMQTLHGYPLCSLRRNLPHQSWASAMQKAVPTPLPLIGQIWPALAIVNHLMCSSSPFPSPFPRHPPLTPLCLHSHTITQSSSFLVIPPSAEPTQSATAPFQAPSKPIPSQSAWLCPLFVSFLKPARWREETLLNLIYSAHGAA